MNREITMGSLFDGSGGFPLASAIHGILPVWASEVEKFPIEVTKKRFPHMEHLGDITRIDGAKIRPVDIITFGSPCQDLSVAGKRAGLKGSRSGLFMEAVRIIKEMREATDGLYPAFAIWENVPGAFSSNRGEDFRVVLEQLVKIVEPDAVVPTPEKSRWRKADALLGDGWSIAWRVLDAQFWGVPQRRRRIYLVADFRDDCAAKILFEPARVFWHPTAGGQTRQRTPPDSQDGSRVPSRDQDAGVTEATICMSTGQANAEILTDISAYLNCNHEAPIITTAGFNGWRSVSGSIEFGQECAPCLNTKMPPDIVAAFMGGQGSKAGGIAYSEQVAPTLKAASSGTNMAPCLVAPAWPDRANALLARHDGSPCIDRGPTVVCVPDPTSFCYDCRGNGTENIVSALTGDHQNRVTDYTTIVCVAGCDFRNMKENGDLCGTLQAKPTGGQSLNCIHPVRIGHRVRRLIPTECARLQGFPDWWCADVPHSDAKEYKMWGNGIALPCAAFVIGQVKKHIDEVNYESS